MSKDAEPLKILSGQNVMLCRALPLLIESMKNPKIKPWMVLCKDGRHYFSSQPQVVKFIAQRKGKIGCIMHDNKLISTELKIYHAGLKLAGLLN